MFHLVFDGLKQNSKKESVVKCLNFLSFELNNSFLILKFCLFNRSTPDYLIWLKYISWFYYGNEMLVVNQWEDVDNISKYVDGQGNNN